MMINILLITFIYLLFRIISTPSKSGGIFVNVNCKHYKREYYQHVGTCKKKKGFFKSKVCDNVNLVESCKIVEPYPRPDPPKRFSPAPPKIRNDK